MSRRTRVPVTGVTAFAVSAVGRALAFGCACTPPAVAAVAAVVAVATVAAVTGCDGPRDAAPAGVPQRTTERPIDAPDAGKELPGEPYAWQAATHSPQPAAPADDLGQACDDHDRALDRAAAWVAERELAGRTSLDADAVTDVLRAEGAPYVWPHVWTLSGGHASDARERFARWLAALPHTNELRCGSALEATGSREVSVGLALDVLADLDPLPTAAPIGAWLDLNARLLVPANAVSVIVLGPRGRSFGVTSSLDHGRVRARFRVDHEGPWLVQLLATVAGGPRPVAEARVFGGPAPTTLAPSLPAPGEAAGAAGDPESGLFAMLNGARASESARPLRRDERLDRVARAHAEAMHQAAELAHDVGDGSPGDRVLSAGVTAMAVGENVAHAADAAHAHRTLWRSPSHRSNLLDPTFDAVGIGAVLDADGTVWVCEVFAALTGPSSGARARRGE
jgi:uncharacterized protein YkwD